MNRWKKDEAGDNEGCKFQERTSYPFRIKCIAQLPAHDIKYLTIICPVPLMQAGSQKRTERERRETFCEEELCFSSRGPLSMESMTNNLKPKTSCEKIRKNCST